jgi:hypothetical protein
MPNAARGDNPDQVIRSFPLLPIQRTIAGVKGTIIGDFCARFMQNPVNRDSLYHFSENDNAGFSRIGIFLETVALLKK